MTWSRSVRAKREDGKKPVSAYAGDLIPRGAGQAKGQFQACRRMQARVRLSDGIATIPNNRVAQVQIVCNLCNRKTIIIVPWTGGRKGHDREKGGGPACYDRGSRGEAT